MLLYKNDVAQLVVKPDIRFDDEVPEESRIPKSKEHGLQTLFLKTVTRVIGMKFRGKTHNLILLKPHTTRRHDLEFKIICYCLTPTSSPLLQGYTPLLTKTHSDHLSKHFHIPPVMATVEPMEIEQVHSEPDQMVQTVSEPEASPSESLMWIEKYRPTGLKDLLSHHEIIETLKTLIANNRLPHLLFCGPPGTGKTSTILACAREMYGSSFKSMVLELNASDDRGLSVVRDQIKNFASTRRIFSTGVKLVILDEADAMTTAAQMALRRVVEKYATNTRFCIICNYVNKIIPALQSRCTKFRFGPLPSQDIKKRVSEIAKMEHVDVTDDGLEALLLLGKGDMRRILNVLQSTAMASMAGDGGSITADAFFANTGSPHPNDIAECWKLLQQSSFQECSDKLSSLKEQRGLALDDIITELLPYIARASLPDHAKMYLYQQLADLEYRMAGGASEKLNMAALIGICKFAIQMPPPPAAKKQGKKGRS